MSDPTPLEEVSDLNLVDDAADDVVAGGFGQLDLYELARKRQALVDDHATVHFGGLTSGTPHQQVLGLRVAALHQDLDALSHPVRVELERDALLELHQTVEPLLLQ